MNNIILARVGEKVTVDSRLVAEHFEKDHFHVMRDISNVVTALTEAEYPSKNPPTPDEKRSIQNWGDLFIATTYADSYGRQQKNYQLTRDGFSLLVMGFTGAKALEWKLKYIAAFNEMEAKLSNQFHIPATYSEALRFCADQADELERQRPLVVFAQTCAASQSSVLIRELAKIASKQGIVIGERKLFQLLRDWHMIFGRHNEPYQEYVDRGYFEVSQGVHTNDKGDFLHHTTRVLPKGQQYIIDRLRTEMALVPAGRRQA